MRNRGGRQPIDIAGAGIHGPLSLAYAGNTATDFGFTRLTAGSSPHTRGAPVDLNAMRAYVGIIPACAGSTALRGKEPQARPGSSPHARGALGAGAPSSTCGGDHPRMRGEHDAAPVIAQGLGGIIPACAGSTRADVTVSEKGEGSSPHARGARARCRCPRTSCGDHPRMRGEHENVWSADDAVVGIIPACAGSTRGCLSKESRYAGSSPTCAGSTGELTPRQVYTRGSSPHARGAPGCVTRDARRNRDHPRMRGEHH